MRFFQAGGFDQLLLEKAEDLRFLANLDQTLWVASSCPTRGLDLEPEFLDFIDDDKDGRIRVPEILSAVNWIMDVLSDASTLPKGSDSVRINQINTDSETGTLIRQTIERIHNNLGISGADEITLEQTLDRSGIFAAVKSNGDGIIPVSAVESEAVGFLIQNILDTIGGAQDLGGEVGVTADGVSAFYKALDAYLRWWVTGHPSDARLIPCEKNIPVSDPEELIEEIEAGQLAAAMEQEAEIREKVEEADESMVKPDASPEFDLIIFPLGEKTPTALAAVNAVRQKVENFFQQTAVAAFDAQAIDFLNFNESDLKGLASRKQSDVEEMLRQVPLAHVEGSSELPLRDGVNPAYTKALRTLNQDAIAIVFGKEKETLSREEWKQVKTVLAPYEQWLDSKAGEEVESLGIARISELLHTPEHREALEALIRVDFALAAEVAAVNLVEKLLRLHRDLFRLLNNYVALPEFYDRDSRAIFQMGTLYIDGCALRLCVEVLDINAHSAIAKSSGIFLVYCQAKRVGEAKDLTICAAVTNRNVGRISVGKNAVFYDRFGKDWDAKVVKVVENPISLRESAWAPFKKIGEVIGSQMEKLTNARQQAMEKSISSSVTDIDKKVAQGPSTTPAPAAAAPSNMGGLVAGGGVAIAAVSSSVAYLAQTLSKINDVYILYTILVIALFVVGPSLILGFIKLRSRDIGMILEAGGWAINGRMRINLTLAKELTHIGQLPSGAKRIPHAYVDTVARRRRRRFWVVFFLVGAIIAGASWYVMEKL